jgi:hypothetical protein
VQPGAATLHIHEGVIGHVLVDCNQRNEQAARTGGVLRYCPKDAAMSSLFEDLAPARLGVAVPALSRRLFGLQPTSDVVDGDGVHSGTAQGAVNTTLVRYGLGYWRVPGE